MTRRLTVLLGTMVLACAAVSAQVYTINIHLKNGKTVEMDDVDIDYIDFTNDPYVSVDLGLSVMWAVCNVGASTPEEYGGLYSWGETQEKKDYSEPYYTYYQNEQYQYIGVNICGTQYDVARQSWGEPWRMPTRQEVSELTSKCQWTADTVGDVKGYRVTGPNGNSIFLPSAGYQDGKERKEAGTGGFYWTGTLNRNMTSSAYNINFRGYDAEWSASRAYGFSVRPVR
jgi:hypothetical protein